MDAMTSAFFVIVVAGVLICISGRFNPNPHERSYH